MTSVTFLNNGDLKNGSDDPRMCLYVHYSVVNYDGIYDGRITLGG